MARIKKSTTPVRFAVGVKNRKPYIVTADEWNLGDSYNHTSLRFFLRGQLVFTVAAQKWDYVERITPVPARDAETQTPE